jgi:hypothetical protein
MSTHRLSRAKAREVSSQWRTAVDDLVDQVRDWSTERGWTATLAEREMTEEGLGSYKIPAVEIATPRGRLLLEPIARYVGGADGRVDLSVWPSLYRVMLLRRPDQGWVVHTESGIDWPFQWGKDTFLDLADRLLKMA